MPDHTHPPLPRSLHALMVGNFVIGTGIMAVPGTLNDISTSLQVSVPQAGQLITAGADGPNRRPGWRTGARPRP